MPSSDSPEQIGNHGSACTCPNCNSPFLHPVSGTELTEDETFALYLKCGACQWSGAVIMDREANAEFDQEFDSGQQAIAKDEIRLRQESFQLVPEDFS